MSAKIKIILSIIGLIFLGLSAGALYFYRETNVSNSNSKDSVITEVKSGDSIEAVAKEFKEKGLLNSPEVFSMYARLAGKEVYAGYYKLPKNLSPKDLFTALTGESFRVYKITIPEGYRTEQIAQKLVESDLVTYRDFMDAAKGEEGHLFPDTYYFSKKTDPKDIVATFKKDFETRTAGMNISEKDLILASIVERETAGDDRAIIAGIYSNRIKINMKLDADPTVQYAKDSDAVASLEVERVLDYKFWKPISSADYYATISPYNTYMNDSLPPGPICNPGLESIKAALNPDKNNYIYFFHVDGQIYPSKTLEEHNANKKKYLY